VREVKLYSVAERAVERWEGYVRPEMGFEVTANAMILAIDALPAFVEVLGLEAEVVAELLADAIQASLRESRERRRRQRRWWLARMWDRWANRGHGAATLFLFGLLLLPFSAPASGEGFAPLTDEERQLVAVPGQPEAPAVVLFEPAESPR
jgi:hypothetical protein